MKRKEGYYWCRIKTFWGIFICWPEGEKWYDGEGNSYDDQDFDEIDERQIIRKENFISLQEIKEMVAERYGKNWDKIQRDYEWSMGVSKLIDFEGLMDKVVEEYLKSNSV